MPCNNDLKDQTGNIVTKLILNIHFVKLFVIFATPLPLYLKSIFQIAPFAKVRFGKKTLLFQKKW
jgi:hypothetical protein